MLSLDEFEQLRSGSGNSLLTGAEDDLEFSKTLADLQAVLKEETELFKPGILAPEVIKRLRISKDEEEKLAYQQGFDQAKHLIEQEPDFRFFCEMNDNAMSFYNQDAFDLSHVDLDAYPADLKYHVIKGFFDSVSAMYLQL